jgi:hypothetical protein
VRPPGAAFAKGLQIEEYCDRSPRAPRNLAMPLMNMEHWWKDIDKGKPNDSEKNYK